MGQVYKNSLGLRIQCNPRLFLRVFAGACLPIVFYSAKAALLLQSEIIFSFSADRTYDGNIPPCGSQDYAFSFL